MCTKCSTRLLRRKGPRAENGYHRYRRHPSWRRGEITLLQEARHNNNPIFLKITVPYLDPALPYSSRQAMLKHSYGFTCICQKCEYQSNLSALPPIPSSPEELKALELVLKDYALISTDFKLSDILRVPQGLPVGCQCLLRDEYLSGTTAKFDKATQEGRLEDGVENGLNVLALYVLAYPRNYPLTGKLAGKVDFLHSQPPRSRPSFFGSSQGCLEPFHYTTRGSSPRKRL